LIEHLHTKLGKPVNLAIHIAQKLLDRIIFIAFCEDRGLLPERCIKDAYERLQPFSLVTNPRWQNFLGLFKAVNKGHPDLKLPIGYNGGLFAEDKEVDNLELEDGWRLREFGAIRRNRPTSPTRMSRVPRTNGP